MVERGADMAKFNEKNYKSINPVANATGKDWSLTGIFKKSVQQATVKLSSGKEYKYASRWPFEEGDVAVIGNSLAQNYEPIKQSGNSGMFGTITYAEPKLTVKRSVAVELDYVFTDKPSKKAITGCSKYIEAPMRFANVQYDKFTGTYFPLSFYIRRLLAAASVVAHPKLTTSDAIDEAKAYIRKEQDFGDMELLSGGPWGPELYFTDTQIHTDGKSLEELDKYGIESVYDTDEFDYDKDLMENLNKYLNKYAYMGAVSIMARGGFMNLLNAFLSAEPLIGDFKDELIGYLKDTVSDEVLAVLKNYCM